MYDPMTEIHTFRIFGHSILAIWHVNPETDGTDDSCGWFNPKVTEREEKIIAEMVDWDMEMPYYSSPYLPLTTVNPKYDYSQMLAGDCLSFVAWTWLHIAWHIRRDKKMTILEWWDVVKLIKRGLRIEELEFMTETTAQFDYFDAGHNYFNVTSPLTDQDFRSIRGVINLVRNAVNNVSIWIDPDYDKSQVEDVLKALREYAE